MLVVNNIIVAWIRWISKTISMCSYVHRLGAKNAIQYCSIMSIGAPVRFSDFVSMILDFITAVFIPGRLEAETLI